RVAIRNVGLMGEKQIAVDLRPTGRAYATKDTIQGVYEAGMGEVMAGLGGSIDVLNRLVTQLDRVASMMSETGEFGQTLKNFRDTSVQLKAAVTENRAAIRTTLANFATSSETVKSLTTGRESQLRATIDHLAEASKNMDMLSQRLDSLRVSIQSAARKVD